MRLTPIVLFSLAACTPGFDLMLDAPPGAQALLFAIELPDAELSLYAYDLAAPPPAFGLKDTAQVSALYYERTLAELFIAPGPVPAFDGLRARPLPDAQLILRGELTPDAHALEPATVLSETLAAFRIASPSANECALAGGCRLRNLCELPCPAPSTIQVPSAAMPPEPPGPDLCPQGWSLSAPDAVGATACAPPTLVPSCPADQTQFLGRVGCAPIGASCGTDDFASAVPLTDVVYVRPGPSNGDGTLAAPFNTIGHALIAAYPGLTLALSGHTFHEAVRLPDRVRLLGACASRTRLLSLSSTEAGILIEASAELANLSVQSATVAILLQAGSSAALYGVQVEPGGSGILAMAGSSLLGEELLVRGQSQRGIELRSAQGQMSKVNVEASQSRAVRVVGRSAQLTVVDLILRDGQPGPQAFGHGLIAEAGAELRLQRAAISGFPALSVGVFAASATISDVLIKVGLPVPGGIKSRAVALRSGAFLYASNLSVSEGADREISVDGGSFLRLVDGILIAPPEPDPVDQAGLHVVGGKAQLERVAIEGYGSWGLYALSSTITIADLIIVGPGDRDGGAAVTSVDGRIDLTRALIRGARGAGVSLLRPSAPASLADLRVEDTRIAANKAGYPILISGQTHSVQIARAEISGSDVRGLNVDAGSASVADLRVEDTTEPAIHLGTGAQLTLNRALLEGGRVGLEFADENTIGEGSTAHVTDLLVRASAERGIDLPNMSTLDLRVFQIQDSRLEAIRLRGRLTMSDGLIADAPAGVRLTAADFDGYDYLDLVRYERVPEPIKSD